MPYVIVSLLLFLCMDSHASEIRHYQDFVIPYSDQEFAMTETPLTHDSYKSYDLKKSLEAFRTRNTEDVGQMWIGIGIWNKLNLDSAEDYVASIKGNIAENVKLGNQIEIVDEGSIGKDVRYLAIVSDEGDTGIGSLEYAIGYVRLGRVVKFQAFYTGDLTNTAAVAEFYRSVNALLNSIRDGDEPVVTGTIPNNESWKKARFQADQ